MTKSIVSTELNITSLGEICARSGFFDDAREASKAIVKILAGQELGLPPIASMTGIDIIKGKISLSAGIMAIILKRHGDYDYRVRKLDYEGCEIEFFFGDESLGVSSFMVEDAKQAGLNGQPNYKKYPRNMFLSRAMSNGIRWYCPEVLGGPTYTPDELEQETKIDTEEIIDGEVSQQIDDFANSLSKYQEAKSLAIELSEAYTGNPNPLDKFDEIVSKIQEKYDYNENDIREMLK